VAIDTSKMTEALPTISKPVTVNVACRDCIFYKKEAHFSNGKTNVPCVQLGRLPGQLPCPAFKINPYLIDFNGTDMLTFANILSNLPANKLSQVAAVLLQEKTTRSNGFSFGQTVYVKVFPDDYISNWAVAKIIAVDTRWVYIQGKRGFRAKIQHTSVLREVEWAQHQAKLRSLGRFTDPKISDYTKVYFRPTLTDTKLQTVDNHGFALSDVNGSRTDFAENKGADSPLASLPRRRGRPRKAPPTTTW
jgi:hypothetical protein